MKNKFKRLMSIILVLVFGTLVAIPNVMIVSASSPSTLSYGFIAQIDPIPTDINVIHINTQTELASIGGSQSEGKYYVLNNDIHLTSEWVPIDDFRGTFDGQGHTINNLYVLASSNRLYAGLFSYIYYDVTIKNVGINISNQGINASYNNFRVFAGGIVGTINSTYGSIVNCYTTGNVNSSTLGSWDVNAGGLAGEVNGNSFIITNSYTTGNITASSVDSGANARGLVGSSYCSNNNNGRIISSSPTGNVHAISTSGAGAKTYSGGLIGLSSGGSISGNIKNSFAMGDVYASSTAPNLADYYNDTIAGGLVGCITNNNNITNSYATGNIYVSNNSPSSFASAGGLIGDISSAASIEILNSYRSNVQVIKENEIEIISNNYGILLTSSQMRQQTSFINWDFNNIWKIDPDINEGYPYLSSSSNLFGNVEDTITMLVIVNMIKDLESEYRHYFYNKIGNSPSNDEVLFGVTNFLRSKKYNTELWYKMTGRKIDIDFVYYVAEMNMELYNSILPYISTETNDIPDGHGGFIDLAHLGATIECYCATMFFPIYAPKFWSGWGGDLASVMSDVTKKINKEPNSNIQDIAELLVGGVSQFNYTDMCTDADAIKIADLIGIPLHNTALYPLGNAMQEYYTSHVQYRYNYYVDDIGCSPNLPSLESKIYNMMTDIVEELQLLSSLGGNPTDEVVRACCNSFAKYIYNNLNF